MKIGLVVHCPSPHQKILLDHLFRVPGVDLRLAYAYPHSSGRNWGVPLADGPSELVPFGSGFGVRSRLRTWITEADRDVWILGSAFTYRPTQSLASLLPETGLPWAFMGEPPRPRSGLRAIVRDYLLHRVLSRCHGVIGTGVATAERYRRLLGDSRPVTSVPYYIPLTEWLDLPLVRPPAPGEPFRFLTLAQLIPRKGIDLLIRALASLNRSDWQLDIYGDGPERGRLQQAIDGSNLPIKLHHSLAFDARMEAFRGKHCFLFPTRWDGWGMALVEALAAGLPTISSDQAMSAHDFIRQGRNGWIVPCNAPALADAISRLMAEPDRLPEMSRAARESVATYDPAAGAQEIVRFCRLLAATAGKSVSARR